MEKLETAKAELRRFEREDRPSYERWLAATFGTMLTELRESARLIEEQEMLLDAVEMEMLDGGHENPRRAYAAVMRRQANPGMGDNSGRNVKDDANDDDPEPDRPPFEDLAGKISAAEKKRLFEKAFKEAVGFNPKQLSREDYEELYSRFEAEIFGTRGGPKIPGDPGPEVPVEPAPEQKRIKEIYRILVRRLHPDTRADGDAAVSSLWHDVQMAYETGDLDRLETLLALTEIEDGSTGASVFQMRTALAELKRALKAIQRSLTQAKRDFAWGFTRNPYHGELEKRIRRAMEEDLAIQRDQIADNKRILDDWSRPWSPTPRKTRKTSRRAAAENQPDQPDLFGF